MSLVRILIISAISFALAFSPFLFLEKESSEQKSYESDGDENPLLRAEWELKRVADPTTGKLPYDIRNREIAFAKTIPTHEEYFGLTSLNKTSNWQQRGPYNIGGRTRALALDATNENIILAGAATGGIWRSTNAGKSWARMTDASTLLSSSCIVQDTRAGKENIWYYGTGEYFGGHIVNGDGIFKSSDSGKTWNHILAKNRPQGNDNTNYIWNIITNPNNKTQDEVWFAATGGIWRSYLGGDSFKLVLNGNDAFGNLALATDIAISKKGVFYATISSEANATQRGIWRSADGKVFTNITPKTFPGTYARMVMGIAPSNENVVYFLGSTPSSGKKGKGWNNDPKYDDWNSLWKYTYLKGDGKDSNGKWENLSNNIPTFHQSTQYIFGDFSSQRAYDLVVRVKPDDENVVFIGGTNVFRSDDGFATNTKIYWAGGYGKSTSIEQDYTYPNHHPDQHNMVFSSSNTKVLYSSNDGGVFRTDNCLDTAVKWTSLNNGYNNTQFYAATLNKNITNGWKFNDIIAGGMQDNSTYAVENTDPPNSPWTKISRGDGGFCEITVNDSETNIYSSLQLGKMYKTSFDKNGNKKGYARIDPIGIPKIAIFIDPFAVDPNNKNVMYMAGNDHLWRNDSLEYLKLLGVDDSIYTGWQKIKSSQVLGDYITSSKYINCISVDPEDANTLIAVISNYSSKSLFYSANAGSKWVDISGNLEEKPTGQGAGPACRWMKIIHSGTDTIFLCGTSVGLFFTNHLAGTHTVWLREASNLIGNVCVEMIDYRPSDGTILIATYGSGVFTGNLNSLVGLKPITKPNLETTLRCFPNPANSFVNLNFGVAANSKTQLKIYDLSGREVYHSTGENLSMGDYSKQINTLDFKAGTYIAVLEIGDMRKTQKLIVTH
ncbi:MAG: T9SS type A sorting domain-containing protein [Bacteroidetes bacterium]|nr:T9SS type A sorting domain-containing protein [Bacteroidota bacterium]